MKESIVSKMTNNTYKVLKLMNNYQMVLPDGTKYVPLSQAEISKAIDVSTITMNKLFKQLKEEDLVLPVDGVRGKYHLTDRAMIILNNMEELERQLEQQAQNK